MNRLAYDQRCQWCGHRRHHTACTRTITTRPTGTANKAIEVACPCRAHEQKGSR